MQGRWDGLKRNLLQLPHQGFALGMDLIGAHRSQRDDWGRHERESGSGHQNYALVSAYASTAGALPGIASDRHRLLDPCTAGRASTWTGFRHLASMAGRKKVNTSRLRGLFSRVPRFGNSFRPTM